MRVCRKYLRTLGLSATNDIFAENAWYFRNALVRANYTNLQKGIHETTEYELFEKAKVYLTTPVRKAGYIDKTQVTENMVFAGETALSEKTMLNPSRVVTYAISEKDYDKTLLTDELIDPDKQVRLELWAYNPKQFSEDNSADDISSGLSFTDTNDERIFKYAMSQFASLAHLLFFIPFEVRSLDRSWQPSWKGSIRQVM